MPFVLDDIPGMLTGTLPANAIAVVLPVPDPTAKYPIKVAVFASTTAALAGWDGTENAALVHGFPINLGGDLLLEDVEVPPREDRQRHVYSLIFSAVPADAETITIAADGTTKVFEADVAANGAAGSNVAVTGGSNLTNWVIALAAAITAQTINVEASANPKDVGRLDIIATTANATIVVTDGTGGDVVRTVDLGRLRPILYVDGTAASAINVFAQRVR